MKNQIQKLESKVVQVLTEINYDFKSIITKEELVKGKNQLRIYIDNKVFIDLSNEDCYYVGMVDMFYDIPLDDELSGVVELLS